MASWQDVLKTVGDTAYSITPADNVMNIAREFQNPKGPNWGNIGKNVLGGAVDVAMFALPAARAGKLAYAGATTLPRIAATKAATRALLTGMSLPLAFNLGGSLGSGGATPASRQYLSWAQDPRNPANKVAATTTVDGGGGNGGAGGAGNAAGAPAAGPVSLPAIDPRVQAQIDAARRQAVSANERAMADIANRGTQLSLGIGQKQRQVGRQARGGILDLMSGLSEMGYATGSPALGGVGQESIAAREAAQRAGVARELAGGRAKLGQETVASQQSLREILNRLQAEELGGRAYASFQGLQNYYGGK